MMPFPPFDFSGGSGGGAGGSLSSDIGATSVAQESKNTFNNNFTGRDRPINTMKKAVFYGSVILAAGAAIYIFTKKTKARKKKKSGYPLKNAKQAAKSGADND